ncbi:MAG: fumarylacetoacetase, partial [Bacteroidota bacterium]
MIKANNPSLKSWIPVLENSDFPIQNIPFGVVKTEDLTPFVATRIGDKVIDLRSLFQLGYLNNLGFVLADFDNQFLNSLMKHGKEATRNLRNRLSELFDLNCNELQQNDVHVREILFDISEVEMCMPIQIGDYTDFYSSKEHATNVGMMFRDPANALLPNWLWIPVGYHGRASSVILSGQNINRPKGQIKPVPTEDPIYAPSRQVDFELEMAFITYDGKPLGDSISTSEADDFIFGLCLFNDWSARDIQAWEYVPLGPFLAKNFASSISPWIVTLDALEPYAVETTKQEPKVLSYLEFEGKKSYDINLQVAIEPENTEETVICNSNFKYMYWNMAQQLAHHTVNGCNIRCGDLMGSGTISGPTEDSYGSMLELAWKGTKPLKMNDGSERKFILDGDTVIMRGHSDANGI